MKIFLAVPSVRELAALYRSALGGKDRSLAVVAEAAVLEIAVAEAALAEAAVLAEFAGYRAPRS